MKTLLLFLSLLLPACLWANKPITHIQQKSSLVFVANAGQVTDQNGKPRKDIDFKLNAPGMDIFLGKGQVHYQWVKANSTIRQYDNSRPDEHPFGRAAMPGELNSELMEQSYTIYRMDVTLLGANTNAQVITEDAQAYYENYYLPQCPNGATAHSFKKITYKNIYPNIDWVLYIESEGEKSALKYDFIVHEGGNVKDIQIRYDGADALALNNGALTATTPFGSITEDAPYTYELTSLKEDTKEIASKFILEHNILSFDVAPHTGTLVIDPKLDWATYYGGAGYDWVSKLRTGKDNSIYITGHTSSISAIATTGAHQTVLSGSADAYIVKMSPTGSRLWGTYYGGAGEDQAVSMAIGSNCIYICGTTSSTSDMTTLYAHQKLFGGANQPQYAGQEAFVAKFNTEGKRVWSTYYGGPEEEDAYDVACDPQHNVYLVGRTNSDTAITTPFGHMPKRNLSNPYLLTGFLVKFDSGGQRRWGTYYGNKTVCRAVACDQLGNIFIGGEGGGAITTPGSDKPVPSDTFDYDAFIVKFDGTGKRLWGTYFGGLGADYCNAMTCDEWNNVYAAGSHSSSGGITPYGGFILVYDPEGKKLREHTSKSTTTTYDDLAVNPGGRILAVLRGNSGSFSLEYFDNTMKSRGTIPFSGNNYSPKGSAAFSSGYILLAGNTTKTTGISFGAAYQPILGGSADGYIAAFRDTTFALNISPTERQFCTYAYVDIPYYVSPNFMFGNTFSVQIFRGNIFNSPVTTLGTITRSGSGVIRCYFPDTLQPTDQYRLRIVSSSPALVSDSIWITIFKGTPNPIIGKDTGLCSGDTLRLAVQNTKPGISYTWTGPANFKDSFSFTTRKHIKLEEAGWYIVSAGWPLCKNNDTITVAVERRPAQPIITHNTPVCEGDTLLLSCVADTSTRTNYKWITPQGSFTLPAYNVMPEATRIFNGKVIAEAEHKGCIARDSAQVTVNITPKVAITSNSPLKAGENLDLRAHSFSGLATYQWNGPDGFSSTMPDNIIYNVADFNGGIYAVTATIGDCQTTTYDSIIVAEGEDKLVLFPNPNNGVFSLRGNLNSEQAIQITITNSLGQPVHNEKISSVRRQVNYTVKVQAIPAGRYYLQVQYPGADRTIPFTITD